MSYLKGIADRINGVENKGFTQELDINSLVPSQNNFYGIREVEELAESIRENGLMHNLVVRKINDDMYEIISGERRYRALKNLGYDKVPCQVKEISDLDAEIMLIQANVEQRELLPTEKMEGIRRLKAIYEQKKASGEQLPKGKIRDLIGEDMKLSGVQVGRYQKVDKDLIKPLKEKLDKEEITLTQAHTLSSLTKDEQEIIHEEIKELNAKESKEEIETLVEGIKQPVNKKDKKFLEEMYPKSRSKEVIFEEFENMIKYDPIPKLIILSAAKAVLNTQKVRIVNGTLSVELTGEDPINSFRIEFKTFDKVQEILIEENRRVALEHGYKINECTYLWFKNGGILNE
ncbi:MAG: ParB/RepB/Spo0J family partition protein [Clostridium beijerinckii]|jgi:ParB family chromosome partitioning protein|nr:ParB/RepB/Spo0J family partition protein [Clostridium beijerinckii]MCI1578604.1 ParB/RepB/Spo0J family partition protein [Clostridium beijerinckii]MCI1582064.1 ParB/RepB/Spo0J family partition protein [Clostridium beijerinckii]MCI1621914.1 ParB/RepB/Spo0J family partition protein [Clostridium beijerinckii]